MKKPVIWFLFFTFSITFDSFSKAVQLPCNDTSFVIIDIEGYDLYNVFSPNK